MVSTPETTPCYAYNMSSSHLQAVQQDARLAGGPWLDLGTGSGAIAVGLATILPAHVQVTLAQELKTMSGFFLCDVTGKYDQEPS